MDIQFIFKRCSERTNFCTVIEYPSKNIHQISFRNIEKMSFRDIRKVSFENSVEDNNSDLEENLTTVMNKKILIKPSIEKEKRKNNLGL